MTFVSPLWLRSGHAQTIFGHVTRSRFQVDYHRVAIAGVDNEPITVDCLEPEGELAGHVVLLHGLEGSSYSPYIQGLSQRASSLGMKSWAINFRSCAQNQQTRDGWIPQVGFRQHHSGFTGDADALICHVRKQTMLPIYVVGISMGGNILLRWLGTNANASLVAAAVAISVPFDLGACAQHLERVGGLIYTREFLKSLKAKARYFYSKFPKELEHVDIKKVVGSKTFINFDDSFTAPACGFESAQHYYESASSMSVLSAIKCPTLCLSADDDPFMPSTMLPKASQRLSTAVEWEVCRGGGHVAFASGLPWAPDFYAEKRSLEWLISNSQ